MIQASSTATRRFRLLWLPILLYFSLGILYMVVIPIGESPDEPGHLQCVEQVARYQHLPQVEPLPQGEWWSRTAIISGHMCYHMPLYYIIGGYTQKAVSTVTGAASHFQFPPSNPEWGASPVMFLHNDETGAAVIDRLPVLSLRLVSLGIGLVIVLVTYQAAALLFPDSTQIALAAATLVAGWPQFVFMSRSISNDVLATALATLSLLVLLYVGRPQRYLVAGGVAALAVLAKLNASFVLVVVVALFLTELLVYWQERRRFIVPALSLVVILGGVALLLLLQPTLYAHSQFALRSFNSVRSDAYTWAYWQEMIRLTVSSAWAHFGWMNVAAPAWQGVTWAVFLVLNAAIGVVLWFKQGKGQRRLVIGMLLFLWTAGVGASYLKINTNRFQPQFRFAFAILPLLATFGAAGYIQITDFVLRRAALPTTPTLAVILLALALVASNVWLIVQVVIPTYG